MVLSKFIYNKKFIFSFDKIIIFKIIFKFLKYKSNLFKNLISLSNLYMKNDILQKISTNSKLKEELTNETYELYDRNIRLWGKNNQIK